MDAHINKDGLSLLKRSHVITEHQTDSTEIISVSKRTTGQDERLTGFKCQTLQLPGTRIGGVAGRQVNSETNNQAYVCPLWLR